MAYVKCSGGGGIKIASGTFEGNAIQTITTNFKPLFIYCCENQTSSYQSILYDSIYSTTNFIFYAVQNYTNTYSIGNPGDRIGFLDVNDNGFQTSRGQSGNRGTYLFFAYG